MKTKSISIIERFKLLAKNFYKDYKTRTFNDKEKVYVYQSRFFNVKQIFEDLKIDDNADAFSFTLMNAQHVIARVAGFPQWNDMIKAPLIELESALKLVNAQKKYERNEE